MPGRQEAFNYLLGERPFRGYKVNLQRLKAMSEGFIVSAGVASLKLIPSGRELEVVVLVTLRKG